MDPQTAAFHEYRRALARLVDNSTAMINHLTGLAEDMAAYPHVILDAVEQSMAGIPVCRFSVFFPREKNNSPT